VYGPGVKANMYNMITLIRKFPVLPFGGIQNKRSMVFVGNLIALIKHIISCQAHGLFIAGDPEPISTTMLAKLIARSLKKKRLFVKIPSFSISLLKQIKPSIGHRLWSSLELDNGNTNQSLGFIPPYSTERGIVEMVGWYLTDYKKAAIV
jgi:nucleoside-diphosphate-sugar epimerase